MAACGNYNNNGNSNGNRKNQVVKVRSERIASCMTCPICKKLLREATTISECLHTFCRKCIYRKLSDEGLECCPTCNLDLGCVPLEKLRPDHNLQDLRSKIFPLKKRKVEAPGEAASVSLPTKRKERSLSSLVVTIPKVATRAITTGRRTKPVTRTASALIGSGFSIDHPIKKVEDPVEESPEGSSTSETVNKLNQNTRQNSSSAEPSKLVAKDEAENDSKTCNAVLDLWQPLNFLVEVASRTKSFKSNFQVSDTKVESFHVPNKEHRARKSKLKQEKDKIKVENVKNNSNIVSSEPLEPKRSYRIRRRKAAVPGNSGISSQSVLQASSTKQERTGPVWFSLVASENQEGDAPLPQVPASYLRLKDGNVPVSFIQKYLMKKLDLANEDEVEIKCMGQPVVPTLLLYNLVDLWLQTSSTPKRISASVGTSAKDFVMVLAYARKTQNAE